MQQGSQGRQSLEAVLLLMKILGDQKQVNRGTADADRARAANLAAFKQTAMALADDQSGIRLDAMRLRRLLSRMPALADYIGEASDKMNTSRVALEALDTGRHTRILQKQIVAMLEKLLGNCKQCMGGGALAQMRIGAMMQMMGTGPNPGGNPGGENAPILPASVDTAEDPWSKVRSRFGELLGGASEEQYPPEFRGLLDAYFERLRKESGR